MKANVKGKRVVIIDDSIVRGETSKHIVRLMREAGAAEVHMLISSPPFVCPCYFGVDIHDKESLIANKLTIYRCRFTWLSQYKQSQKNC
mgnify:CR=1 FL=1